MSVPDSTPVLIGVGETSEHIDAAGYAALSPVELASAAARAACDDALSVAALAPHIDLIAAIRQFEVSTPVAKAVFGASDNFPRSVARRLGADPARAVLEITGGQGPQSLVNEFAHAIAAGEVQMALLVGAESISTVRHLMSNNQARDWSETVGGQLEDRGYGLDGLLTPDLTKHGARSPVHLYALYENARRAKLGLSRTQYQLAMGELFAPFTEVASHNPHAMSQEVFSAAELAEVTPKNRLICDPLPRRMVARDQANQGAALLLTSVGKARELGVPEDRWVYLHGGADVKERTPVERQDLAAYPAATLAAKQALDGAGKSVSDIALFDFYSCFPIAVFDIRDALDIAADDPRPLTLTGGLPFFGGAGNNYSMHAIASMARALRARPGDFGFIGANGGFLSKYSTGVYSTTAAPFKPFESKTLQARIKAWPAPALEAAPSEGRIETYTIDYGAKVPRGIVIARDAANARFIAMTDDQDLVGAMIRNEPLGAAITVAANAEGRVEIKTFTPAA